MYAMKKREMEMEAHAGQQEGRKTEVRVSGQRNGLSGCSVPLATQDLMYEFCESYNTVLCSLILLPYCLGGGRRHSQTLSAQNIFSKATTKIRNALISVFYIHGAEAASDYHYEEAPITTHGNTHN